LASSVRARPARPNPPCASRTASARSSGARFDFIDTENRRALVYADKHRFNHVDFQKPFSPLDYLAAIRYCVKRGRAKTIVVDSGSHEHEGPGGVLEWHEAETERLAKLWKTSTDKASMAAWGPPKRARRRLINEVLQMNVNVIFTFRAKEKLKIVAGKDPQPLGWMPISGEEWMYEFALQALLPPGSKGTPRWHTSLEGERVMIKLPEHLEHIFKDGEQLSEEHGRKLAEWAQGGAKLSSEAEELIGLYAKAESQDAYKDLEAKRGIAWKKLPPSDKARVKAASDAALERITNPQGRDLLGDAPPPSADTWVETLNACSDLEQLGKTWDGCRAAFNDDPPNECDEAYRLRREAIREAAA
jgi:hypothetical protein